MSTLNKAIAFLNARDEGVGNAARPADTSPSMRLASAIQGGRTIAFTDIPGTIGANPEVTAVLVNQLLASGQARVVKRTDRGGDFLAGLAKPGR